MKKIRQHRPVPHGETSPVPLGRIAAGSAVPPKLPFCKTVSFSRAGTLCVPKRLPSHARLTSPLPAGAPALGSRLGSVLRAGLSRGASTVPRSLPDACPPYFSPSWPLSYYRITGARACQDGGFSSFYMKNERTSFRRATNLHGKNRMAGLIMREEAIFRLAWMDGGF